jgi:catechol 2,3-dioxygenase-like lactoylglutathione lyase family enzyme
VSTEKRRRAAAALLRRGVAVIPVPAGEKNPGRPGWEALRITEEEIPDYWTNGQNVGLLCGEPSGGRVDVDLDSPDQRERFPRPSDVGIQHLALYVDDLDAATEHLRRHGVDLMSGPNPLPGPEAGEGNRFIYARTPWGLTVELISYPAPMAYERHNDAHRWRPKPTDR